MTAGNAVRNSYTLPGRRDAGREFLLRFSLFRRTELHKKAGLPLRTVPCFRICFPGLFGVDGSEGEGSRAGDGVGRQREGSFLDAEGSEGALRFSPAEERSIRDRGDFWI